MIPKANVKLIVSLILAASMILSFCACGGKDPETDHMLDGPGSVNTSAAPVSSSGDGDIPAPKGGEDPGMMQPYGTYGGGFDAIREQKLELPGAYSELADAIIELRNYGLDLLSGDLALQAEYAITLSESYATSVRYACDLILKNRGVTSENVGLFADWNQIKHLSLSSTMPYLMQSISEADAGDSEAAKDHLDWYQLMEFAVPGEENLMDLASDTTENLQALREALANYECDIYNFYPMSPDDEELTGYENLTSYHVLVAETYMDQGLYQRALQSYENAVKTNPFDIGLIGDAAWGAICAGDPQTALEYIDAGLIYDPDDSGINLMAALLFAAAGDADAASGYLESARSAGLTESQETVAGKVEAYLEGGA